MGVCCVASCAQACAWVLRVVGEEGVRRRDARRGPRPPLPARGDPSPRPPLLSAVSFSIITTAAFTAVKKSWEKDLRGGNYLLYGPGYGFNIASWILGVFCVVLLLWPLVPEYPHALSKWLPPVPPPKPKAGDADPVAAPAPRPDDVIEFKP
jgi:hypothetical protein